MLSFNRTMLELKSHNPTLSQDKGISFNRTMLELKFLSKSCIVMPLPF